MKVLAVHRQETVLQNIRRQLESTGWQVTCMTSAVGAMLASRQNVYDLVICGFDLPVVSCIELARCLRNYHVNRATPVVILSEGTESLAHLELARRLQAQVMTLDEIFDFVPQL